jgi:protein-tyrosine phosphatase
MQARVNSENLESKIIIDSAGTGDWHLGFPPDERAQKIALQHGYDMSHLQARLVTSADFSVFDYILGMDKENVKNLVLMKPQHFAGVCGLFLTEAGLTQPGVTAANEVPDPYYGDEQHFEQAIQLIQDAVGGLLQRIKTDHSL